MDATENTRTRHCSVQVYLGCGTIVATHQLPRRPKSKIGCGGGRGGRELHGYSCESHCLTVNWPAQYEHAGAPAWVLATAHIADGAVVSGAGSQGEHLTRTSLNFTCRLDRAATWDIMVILSRWGADSASNSMILRCGPRLFLVCSVSLGCFWRVFSSLAACPDYLCPSSPLGGVVPLNAC
jgi:hypothetical protein